MAKGLIGKKLGMTHLFDSETGQMTPVTVVEAGPCVVVQLKSVENDGYSKVQLGFAEQKASRVNKPLTGHFAKAECKPMRLLREFDSPAPDVKPGDEVTLSIFENVRKVDVSGITKGQGFQGVIKRFKGQRGRKTHGGHSYRIPGSIGQCSYPGKVFKGKHMPGQMGNVRRTIQNLEIVKMDVERNLLFLKGAVPGHNNGILLIREAVKG
jgi:large subunit ribosomal protein L3